MVNYYEALKLDPKLSAEEIWEKLEEKYSDAIRKLNNAGGNAEREYRIRKELELIEAAREIFRTAEGRQEYDKKLRESMRSDDKKGLLMNERIEDLQEEDDESGGPEYDESGEEAYEDDEDEEIRKEIERLLKKKRAKKKKASNDTPPPQPSDSSNYEKAYNLSLRANQEMGAGNLNEAKKYIDMALQTDAKNYFAWTIKFYLEINLCQKMFDFSEIYRLPENSTSKAVLEAKGIREKIDNLHKLMGNMNPGSKVQNLKELEEPVQLIEDIRKWISEGGPQRVIDENVERCKDRMQKADLSKLMAVSKLNANARNAYKYAMEYCPEDKKQMQYDELHDLLQRVWGDELKREYQKCMEGVLHRVDCLQNKLSEYESYINSVRDIVRKRIKDRRSIPKNLLCTVITLLSLPMVSEYWISNVYEWWRYDIILKFFESVPLLGGLQDWISNSPILGWIQLHLCLALIMLIFSLLRKYYFSVGVWLIGAIPNLAYLIDQIGLAIKSSDDFLGAFFNVILVVVIFGFVLVFWFGALEIPISLSNSALSKIDVKKPEIDQSLQVFKKEKQ